MVKLLTNLSWACRLIATQSKKRDKIFTQTFTTLPENVGLEDCRAVIKSELSCGHHIKSNRITILVRTINRDLVG